MWKRVLVSAAVIGVSAVSSLASAVRPGNPPTSEPHLVAISDIVVPVIDANRFNGHLSFAIVIDAIDADSAARLTAGAARLRSTTIASGLEFSRLYVSGARPVDAQVLATELTSSLRAANPDIDRVLVVKVAASAG